MAKTKIKAAGTETKAEPARQEQPVTQFDYYDSLARDLMVAHPNLTFEQAKEMLEATGL